jgi:hypothetical protein
LRQDEIWGLGDTDDEPNFPCFFVIRWNNGPPPATDRWLVEPAQIYLGVEISKCIALPVHDREDPENPKCFLYDIPGEIA